jgi:hypothetical protein
MVPITFNGHADELSAGADVVFREELLQRILDCALGDFHPPGDFLISQTLNQEPKHIAFPSVQRRSPIMFGSGCTRNNIHLFRYIRDDCSRF